MSVVSSDGMTSDLSLEIVSAIFSLSFGCSIAGWTVSVVSATGCEPIGLANEGLVQMEASQIQESIPLAKNEHDY